MPFYDKFQDQFANSRLGGMLGINPATAAGYEARALQGFTPDEIQQWGGAQPGTMDAIGRGELRDVGSAMLDAGDAYNKQLQAGMANIKPLSVNLANERPFFAGYQPQVEAMNPLASMRGGDQQRMAQMLRGY